MHAAATHDRSSATDTYLSSSTKLWDGSLLSELVTPRHDLSKRVRPFPVQRNYFYAAAMHHSARWLREQMAMAPAEYQRLLREDVGGFVSWVYPDATAGQIRALSDFHFWAVRLDDLMDRKTAAATSLSACALLETVGAAELAPFDDFFGRMRALGMSRRCADRFTHALRLYGASSRQEVKAREGQARFGSVSGYITNRRTSAAMPVYYALAAWISRIDLPEELYQHPVVTRLENSCSDYSLLYNDAGSFIKERLAGRSEGTFVRLLSQQQGLSVQDTLYEIADMAAAAADDLEATSDIIDGCGLPVHQREQIHRYADALRKFVGGVNHWSNHTCRYLVGQPLVDTPATSRAGDVHHLRPAAIPHESHRPASMTGRPNDDRWRPWQ
ncbi:terpene synthase family protein [Actinomadura rubrisoli]|uniref:Terpene synthase n=1 Tax=Actinomadura rubrisoli TaxID=2530368 RepID=A0A4V2YVB5_9ACTN|nr:hypothetical protein [Actinomadura rubrisoli]TDD80917.1 hypothetical protein E1298_25010 [Actinomadura rubrisoli]